MAAAELTCVKRSIHTPDNRTLSGIEDLVYHPPSETLILSVHDRWGDRDGDENAVRGLYGLPLTALDDARPEAVRLIDDPDMRPHGLALRRFDGQPPVPGEDPGPMPEPNQASSAVGNAQAWIPAQGRDGGIWRLLVINHRTHQKETTKSGEPGTVIDAYYVQPDGSLRKQPTPQAPGWCTANDLDWLDTDRAIVTLDRENCGGFWRFLELSRGQKRGRLAIFDLRGDGRPQIIAEGLGFPNGVLADARGIYVSFSRERRLARYRLTGDKLEEIASIDLDGGGDNISAAADQSLLVAVHPGVMRFGLYSLRFPGFSSAATQASRFDGELRKRQPLIDAPNDAPINGASTIIEAGASLIAGSAFDSGLMVCR